MRARRPTRAGLLALTLGVIAAFVFILTVDAKASRGPDVSSYQGCSINWHAVKASGDAFAFAKATEGLTYHDACFGRNWHEIRAAGLYRGAYHFGHADSFRSPESECFTYLGEIRAHDDNFDKSSVPVLDIEAGNLTGASLGAWVDRFTKCVQDRWGRAGLIYSGAWYLRDRGAYVWGSIQRGWKLWTSAYGSSPNTYSGFPTWTFWQFTDGVYGPQPHCTPGVGCGDVSTFNGSDDQLRSFFNLAPDVPPEVKKLQDQITYFWDHRPVQDRKTYDSDMNRIYFLGWQPHRSGPSHDWAFKPGAREQWICTEVQKHWAKNRHGRYVRRLLDEAWSRSHTRVHLYGCVRMPGFYRVAG